EDVRGRPDQGDARSAQYLEEGGVVVEHIPVLKEPLAPSPSHVTTLGLIRVDHMMEAVDQAQEQHGAADQAEKCGLSARQWRVGRRTLASDLRGPDHGLAAPTNP